MVVDNRLYNGINKIPSVQSSPIVNKSEQKDGLFESILQQKIIKGNVSDIKFSKHAEMRLQARNINLSETQKDKIGNAINRAGEKGVKDSLVVVDDFAFVVNIKNRTVITALNSKELKENVFTNIDGAVFA
jgi:flagellar operon protein